MNKRVQGLITLINASKDETMRLGKQLRELREKCKHSTVKVIMEEKLFSRRTSVVLEECEECGLLLSRTIKEKFNA